MSDIGRKELVDVDVAVLGAGLSGLTAAYTIKSRDPGIQLIVIEAKDRIGGRTIGQTLKTASGQETWDLGGQWIGSCQTDIMELLKELNISTYEQYTTGAKLMQLSGTERVSSYTSDIPSLPGLSLLDLHLFIRKIESMHPAIDVSDPGRCQLAAEWDATTLEQFKQANMWTTAAKRSLDAAIRCIFGAEPSDISLLYFLTYVAAAGGLDPLISSRRNHGGQELRVVGGAWNISHRLAEAIGHSKIRLSEPVVSIRQDGGIEHVLVETAPGKLYRCKRVVMALPPTRAVEIDFYPPLPVTRQHVWQRMPAGNITKVIVTYKTAFWRAVGLSGEALTIGGKSIVSGCCQGPLCIVYDATSSTGSPALVSFIAGIQQLQYANIPSDERRRAVLHNLSELFGSDALSPVDYCEKNWNDEVYCDGGPVSMCTTGAMVYSASALRQPLDKIHFAGTESATRWCGFMSGAVQSGKRAAMEVLYNLRPQALSAVDLKGTVYDVVRNSKPPGTVSRVQSSKSHWLWQPAIIGLVALLAVYIRRRNLT